MGAGTQNGRTQDCFGFLNLVQLFAFLLFFLLKYSWHTFKNPHIVDIPLFSFLNNSNHQITTHVKVLRKMFRTADSQAIGFFCLFSFFCFFIFWMFIAALFTTAKKDKEPKCPWTVEWMNKLHFLPFHSSPRCPSRKRLSIMSFQQFTRIPFSLHLSSTEYDYYLF